MSEILLEEYGYLLYCNSCGRHEQECDCDMECEGECCINCGLDITYCRCNR